jgi:hypothetical protein
MGHDNANAENNQSPRQSRKHSYLPRRPEVERREGCTVKIIQELRWISQPTVELASRPIQVCCNSENLISALRFRELVVAIEHLSDESVFGALRQHARTDSGRHWCGKPPLSPWRPSKTVDGAFARGLGPTLADISRLSFGAARWRRSGKANFNERRLSRKPMDAAAGRSVAFNHPGGASTYGDPAQTAPLYCACLCASAQPRPFAQAAQAKAASGPMTTRTRYGSCQAWLRLLRRC